jgi:glycosyltransferase involved in cell wall biosynthesis
MSSNIAIVHPDFSLTKIGGEEVICMHVLEALQDDHDLTLFSLTPPNLADLDEFADTDVATDDPPVVSLTATRQLPAAASFANRLSGGRLGLQRPLLVGAFNRLVNRREDEFDYVISTSNEMRFDTPSMQYIHFPRYNLSRLDEEIGIHGPVSTLYDRACAAIAGVDEHTLSDVTLLANSRWTAGVVESVYGTGPEVVYPPLNTDAFDRHVPWAERESGFVSIGRLTPAKNVLTNVDIVRRLHERGHDVHLHLVGPTATDHEDYRRKLERTAAEHDFVHLDGRLDREAMIDLIGSHRYGLHGKKYEHFGIAVAELVAGGTIPFIRNASGQREVVGEQEAVMYDTADEAVTKIERVLENPDRQRRIRRRLPEVEERFGRERFKNTIRELVEADLNER